MVQCEADTAGTYHITLQPADTGTVSPAGPVQVTAKPYRAQAEIQWNISGKSRRITVICSVTSDQGQDESSAGLVVRDAHPPSLVKEKAWHFTGSHPKQKIGQEFTITLKAEDLAIGQAEGSVSGIDQIKIDKIGPITISPAIIDPPGDFPGPPTNTLRGPTPFAAIFTAQCHHPGKASIRAIITDTAGWSTITADESFTCVP